MKTFKWSKKRFNPAVNKGDMATQKFPIHFLWWVIQADKLCTAATVYFLWAKWFVHACHYFICSNYKGSGEHEQGLVHGFDIQFLNNL